MTGIGAYAHEAELDMDAGGDIRAPGGAITMALCGAYDHAPPCPLAPHHTDAHRAGEIVSVRVLFACRPSDAVLVRGRIRAALDGGVGTDPDGASTQWQVRREGPADVMPTERDHADRLIATLSPD